MTSLKWALQTIAIATAATMSLAARAEEPKVFTDDKIKALIKDLGDDDFAKRQNAEKDLVRAGLKAMDALKAAQASTDPQVKATASKLVGKIRLSNLPAVDYFEVAPANSIVAVQLKNVANTIENAKKSAVGQLILSQALEPFRKKIDAAISENPEGKKQFLLWSERFKGQAAFALWKLNMAGPAPEVQLGAMLEITDPDPQAVYDDFVNKTGIFAGGMKPTMYKDVEIQHSALEAGGPTLALVGKHLLIGPNIESLQKLVDGILTPGGLAKKEEYQKLKASAGAKPEMLMVMDYPAYMKAVLEAAPVGFTEDSFRQLMNAAGVDIKLMMISSACNGDSFEDRYIVSGDGPPKGLAAAAIPPADAPAPINDMSIQPSNAVFASTAYMDGALMKTALTDYIAGLKKMMDAMKAAQGQQQAFPDFDAIIKTFEDKSGLKLADVAANIKGTVGYNVVLAPGGALMPPDINIFITCGTAEKAKAFSEAVTKAFAAFDKKAAIREVDAPNRKIYQLDLAALGMPLQPNFPYTPCWSIEGNRIFIASSIAGLRKQLSYIEQKTPGLLTQPDFIKAMGALSPDERKGQVMYVDMKGLLTFGATVGLPLLQAQVPDPEVKKILAGLPPPAELFKNIPPALMTSVYQGNQMMSILRSPLPPLQSLILLAFTAGFARAGPNGPIDLAPGF